MEADLNEIDIYCIQHFGYNKVGDINKLRCKQDNGHLIIEEFEYKIAKLEEQVSELKGENKFLSKQYDEMFDDMNKVIEKSLIKSVLDRKITALKCSRIDNILKCEFERLRDELLKE